MASSTLITGSLCFAAFLVTYAMAFGLRSAALLGFVAVFPFVGLFIGIFPRRLCDLISFFIHKFIEKSPHASHPKLPSRASFNYHCVAPRVYLGRQPRTEEDIMELHNLRGVRAIICFNSPWELYVSRGDEIWDRLGWSRLDLPCPDFSASTIDELESGIEFLKTHVPNASVYVHCNAGKGRSAVMAGVYLRALYGDERSPKEIFAEMKRVRPQISNSLMRYPWSAQARAFHHFDASRSSLQDSLQNFKKDS